MFFLYNRKAYSLAELPSLLHLPPQVVSVLDGELSAYKKEHNVVTALVVGSRLA